MRDILKLMVVLTLISSAAGLILAFTSKVTSVRIATAAKTETVRSLSAVLPEFDNDPGQSSLTVTEEGRAWTFYVGRKSGAFTGAAFETSSPNGYGGEIRLMVGVTAGKVVTRIEILSQKETPGLGTKITEKPFIQQFDGRRIEGTTWTVRKDRGDFDAITGATISSRAVLEAVRTGLGVYEKHAAEIARKGE